MKTPLALLVFLYVLKESYGYKYCAYTSYSNVYRKYMTYYYRCSSSQYCCGVQSCCAYVYTRWYLWFIIVSFFIVVFILWWYYRYRYRPRHVVVGQGVGVVNAPGGAGIITGGDVNVIRVNAPYATYPQAGPVTIMPGGSSVHYAAYPPPVYGPVQTVHPPPPAYSSVVKTGTTVTATTIQ